ncbi:hypothetical protein HID58_094904, partial [Brassica napus]
IFLFILLFICYLLLNMNPEIPKQGEAFLNSSITNMKTGPITATNRSKRSQKNSEKKREGGALEPDENDRIKSLKNFLLDQKVYNEFKTLVVVGEYGVGKTALCKTIFNDDGREEFYAPRIWVSMHSTERLLKTV